MKKITIIAISVLLLQCSRLFSQVSATPDTKGMFTFEMWIGYSNLQGQKINDTLSSYNWPLPPKSGPQIGLGISKFYFENWKVMWNLKYLLHTSSDDSIASTYSELLTGFTVAYWKSNLYIGESKFLIAPFMSYSVGACFLEVSNINVSPIQNFSQNKVGVYLTSNLIHEISCGIDFVFAGGKNKQGKCIGFRPTYSLLLGQTQWNETSLPNGRKGCFAVSIFWGIALRRV